MITQRQLAFCCLGSFLFGAGLVYVAGGHNKAPDSAPGNTQDSAQTMSGSAQPSGATRREPQFENDDVKSWKSIIMPNQPLNLHRHENGRALIALTDGQLQVVDSAGKVINTYDWERGKAYWLGPDPAGEMHADLNKTTKAIEVIVVELKKKAGQ